MSKPLPERVWLQAPHPVFGVSWTWADREVEPSDTEYVRADLAPSNAALAVCEAMLSLYSPSGDWVGDEVDPSPFPRLWRMLQVVTNAPRVPGERWAPYEALMRECAVRLTGRTMDEVTEPLSHLLHTLRYRHLEEVEGMIVTDAEAWYEGEDGG